MEKSHLGTGKRVRFQGKTFRVTEHDVDQIAGEEIIEDHVFYAGINGNNKKPNAKNKKRLCPIKWVTFLL